MFGEQPLDDSTRFLRAFATNLVARFAPGAYVKLTGQTGRGEAQSESAASMADYFFQCYDDYFLELGVEPTRVSAFLNGKCMLEYGPGDLPGVALLMYAHGAAKVYCVDRFPLMALSEKNAHALALLLERLPPRIRSRAEVAVRQWENSRHQADRAIEYLVRPNGLSSLKGEVDIVFSRAVLEHVNELEATYFDMAGALRPDGIAIHMVDLRSHGLHRRNRLDFLSWPEPMWNVMYSGKGLPNRHRVNSYRAMEERAGLIRVSLRAAEVALPHEVDEVRAHLARRFQEITDEDLAWLGFWLVSRKPA